MANTSTGLDEKVAALLSYILGWVTGIVFLIIEPKNPYVRFHAMQSIIVFGFLNIATLIFNWIPVVGTIINIVAGILAFVLWIILLIKSSQGELYKVRWAGDLAEKWSKGQS